jgi:DNA-binding NarL/FixJ family response regulator
MAEGRSNPGIARRLVMSDGAVEKHVSNIVAKLGLPRATDDHRRVLAVLASIEGRAPPRSTRAVTPVRCRAST